MTFDDLFHSEILSVAGAATQRAREALVTMAAQGNHHESTRLAGVIQTLENVLPDILVEARENIDKR